MSPILMHGEALKNTDMRFSPHFGDFIFDAMRGLVRYCKGLAIRSIRARVSADMATPLLPPELAELVSTLATAFAQHQRVVSAKARIGLFYQNPAATELFRKVSDFGEELHAKSAAGMSPTEQEFTRFDELRSDVIKNPLCKGFLEAREELDSMLRAVNQYLCLAIEKGQTPTAQEVEDSLTQQVSTCSCGGHCSGECGEDCDGRCREKGKHCKKQG